ncbi:MAG: winged helix-turn-helix transcriptional regulator [Haloferacaceae archaeon]
MNQTRIDVRDHIVANPGVHFNELVRALDIAPGQVQYHVRRLQRRGDVVAESLYGRTHYYPPTFDEWERSAVALFRRETARDVLGSLLEAGEARPSEVADSLGVARSTLEWHLDHLTEQDVVRKRKEGNRVVLELERPDATRELLADVSPSLPERFLDRFTRLVDGLLEEAAN